MTWIWRPKQLSSHQNHGQYAIDQTQQICSEMICFRAVSSASVALHDNVNDQSAVVHHNPAQYSKSTDLHFMEYRDMQLAIDSCCDLCGMCGSSMWPSGYSICIQDQRVWCSIPSAGHVKKCWPNFVFHTVSVHPPVMGRQYADPEGLMAEFEGFTLWYGSSVGFWW